MMWEKIDSEGLTFTRVYAAPTAVHGRIAATVYKTIGGLWNWELTNYRGASVNTLASAVDVETAAAAKNQATRAAANFINGTRYAYIGAGFRLWHRGATLNIADRHHAILSIPTADIFAAYAYTVLMATATELSFNLEKIKVIAWDNARIFLSGNGGYCIVDFYGGAFYERATITGALECVIKINKY